MMFELISVIKKGLWMVLHVWHQAARLYEIQCSFTDFFCVKGLQVMSVNVFDVPVFKSLYNMVQDIV